MYRLDSEPDKVNINVKKKLEDMFKLSFKFLKHFVINNPDNQLILSENLVFLIVDMHLDLG